jgi:hypothetical protein
MLNSKGVTSEVAIDGPFALTRVIPMSHGFSNNMFTAVFLPMAVLYLITLLNIARRFVTRSSPTGEKYGEDFKTTILIFAHLDQILLATVAIDLVQIFQNYSDFVNRVPDSGFISEVIVKYSFAVSIILLITHVAVYILLGERYFRRLKYPESNDIYGYLIKTIGGVVILFSNAFTVSSLLSITYS